MVAEFLLCCFLLAGTVTASCLETPPIALPVKDVELSNGFTMRGVPFSVGNPPQNISALPHDYLNNTWVYNATSPFCFDRTTKAQCLTMRGGTFDRSESSTASESLDVVNAGGDPSDVARTAGTHIWHNDWAKDTLIAGNATLEDFPVGMPGFDYGEIFDTQANLGLGQNSTLLSALQSSGQIASRSYSFWWGLNSASSHKSMDGQLVLGGYDAAKVQGPNMTQKLLPSSLSCPSGMYLTVTHMALGFPNGTTADMLAPSVLSACIRLDWPAIASPRYDPFVMRFEAATSTSHEENTASLPWEVPAYRLAGGYGGDLTLILDQGTRFTIPNDLLILPSEYVASNGEFRTNASAPGIQLTPTLNVNVNDVPWIGRPFFSAAYIMVDLDAETWTLWQANATTDSRLISVGKSCTQQPKTNSSSPDNPAVEDTDGSDALPEATAAADSSESQSGGLKTAVIVGIAVGAALAVGVLVGALVFCCLKRRQRARFSSSHGDPNATGHGPGSERIGTVWHEKDGGTVQELSALQIHHHELPTREKPSEIPGGHWDSRPVELSAMQTPRA